MLGEGDDFFGHHRVHDRLSGPLRALFVGHRAAAERLLVYGELLGGGYPHPDVAPIPGVQPIQTGIWYTPDVAFLAFDVVAEDQQGRRRWWGHAEMTAALGSAGVPMLEAMFIGRYTEAQEQTADFQTTIPARYGLPALADNHAEGVVLKPSEPILVQGRRPTIKNKAARFAEDARYHQAARWATPPPQAAPLDLLEFAIVSRLNPARFASARSKLGQSAPATTLSAEIYADVMVDIRAAHGDLFRRLSPEDAQLIDAMLQQECDDLAQQHT
jgi:hypothetical protein